MKLRLAALALVTSATVAPVLSWAQVPSLYQEQGELMRASRTVGTLGADLFGDSVDLYTGKLSFRQTDVSLPGNNALPVSVGRTLETGAVTITTPVDRAFANWELDIPHLQGIFAKQGGWQAQFTNLNGTRCTNYGPPPGGGGNAGPSDWAAVEYWFGNFLVIPGQGSQEMLYYPGGPNAPIDGHDWPIVTKGLWAMRCLTTGMSYGSGEGFIARSPDGTEYTFDHMVSRPYPAATKASRQIDPYRVAGGDGSNGGSNPIGPTPDAYNGGLLYRIEVWIMPSVITDRFGNTVTYHYNAAEPWKITSIEASDGRVITFNYVAVGSPHIASVSDGTRTWTYSYTAAAGGLAAVTLPDNSAWQFDAAELTTSNIQLYTASPSCENDGGIDMRSVSGTMRHPSGAIGTFAVQSTSHSKSFVNRICYDHGDGSEHAYFPRFFSMKSLIGKTISGPGVPAETWSYSYSNPIDSSSWSNCLGACQDFKTVTVTDPRNVATRYTFGNRHMVTEGQLQKVEAGWNGTTALRTTTMHYRASDAGPYPWSAGNSYQPRGNGLMAAQFTPLDQRVINQQGVDFPWSAGDFDIKARPTTVTRGDRVEITTFADNTNRWVLGQIGSLTVAGRIAVSNAYDPTTASLLSKSTFGRLESSFGYYSDGTLATKRDGAQQTTTFSNYKRGLAQKSTYADGTTESAVVDDLGLIRSVNDPNGYTTGYRYDAMGRLSQIDYPTGDSLGWNSTQIAFEPVPAAEVGLDAGHWRQTVSTGNGQTVTYFDAFWRPRLSKTVDIGNPATAKTVLRRFDPDNRKVFESYPAISIASVEALVPGTTTSYDPIGRVSQVQADSELGLLSTRMEYLGGFVKRVTNPRGYQSTWTYQVFDQPDESAMIGMWTPGDATTSISRDVFGKPLSITRSGTYSGTGPNDPAQAVSVSRSYVYDPLGEILCKTVEPEVGATIEAHNLAGNLSWSATGLALPSLTSCDYASVPESKKISYGYTSRNQLRETHFGDGSPGIYRAYYADGLPYNLYSNGFYLVYYYNKRRLLTDEFLSASGDPAWYALSHGYDGNGNRSKTTYPDATSVTYAPNALGEPTQVGSYASGITHFPNGAVAGYTLGNGIVHSNTQNARGLPRTINDLGVYQLQYDYDPSGNVTTLTDLQQGVTTTTMSYDGLDRLATANSPNQWGAASYAYDPVDNLRRSIVGGRDATHHYSDNKLQYISIAGQASIDYGYDAQGNILSRAGQGYAFDIGNRMTLASGLETYQYDGLGRRVRLIGANGRNKFQMYAQAGKLMYGTEQTPGNSPASVKYIYVGDRLIAETYSDGTTNYVHTDGMGSPIARTNGSAVPGPYTRYEPYGYTSSGPLPSPIGFTGHVNDVDTGLVYMQQRYYDSWAGRFMSVDPVTTDAATPGSFGRYHYAHNNPYRYVDPDGRWSCTGNGITSAGCEMVVDADPHGGSERSGGGSSSTGNVYFGGTNMGMSGVTWEDNDELVAQFFPPTMILTEPPVVARPVLPRMTPLDELPAGSSGGVNAGKPFPRALRRNTPDGEPCIFCKEPTTKGPGPRQLQLDHIRPANPRPPAPGAGAPERGNNSPSNKGNSCQPCNGSKSNRTPAEWYRDNGWAFLGWQIEQLQDLF